MKKILKMPLRRIARRPPPAESLRAKAAANPETYEDEDYETEEEPNMKFSHALVVVLALHIIAVGGVFAFNSIKAGQTAATKGANSPPAGQGTALSKPSPAQGAIEGWAGKTHTVQAGDTLSRIATLYKTSLELIEKENGITTYSMIRVGQVLKIPASASLPVPKPATDPITAAAKHAFLAAKAEIAKAPIVAAKTEIPKPAVAAKTEIPKPPAAIAKTDIAKPPVVAAKTDVAKPPAIAAKADVPKPPAVAAKTDVAKPPAIAAKTDIPKPPAVAAKTDVAKPAAAAPETHPAATPTSAKQAEVPPPATESDVYVVAKGDNPYNIAKKLHVSYNDLIAINEIKDPTRVQIGQKLKIPAKKN